MPHPGTAGRPGLFILANGTFTNTFAGTVAVAVGATNSVSLPGGAYSLVGSAIPYAGDITAGSYGGPHQTAFQSKHGLGLLHGKPTTFR